MLINAADDGSEYLANISHHREGEGDTNDSKDNTEDTARKGDRRDIAIANSSDDGGGEEDRLDEVPADSEVLVHQADPCTNSFRHN